MSELNQDSIEQSLLNAPLHPLEWTLGRACLKLTGSQVYGLENIPEDEAFVLALTHHNSWDAIAAGTVLPKERAVSFMAKSDFFESRIPFLAGLKSDFWLNSGAFPVNRGAQDLNAVKMGVHLLNAGQVVAIAPESGTLKGYTVNSLSSGASLMTGIANVKKLPVAIAGRQDLFAFMPRKLVTFIGEALPAPDLNEEERDINSTSDWRDLSPELRAYVRSDRKKLKKILQSLFDMAIDEYNKSRPKRPIAEKPRY